MNSDIEARFQALELKLAHQEQILDDLNDMVTRQWQGIDRLERHIHRLKDQVAELESGAGKGVGKDPPPPHY